MIRIAPTDRLEESIEGNQGQRIELEPGAYVMSRPAELSQRTEIVGGGEWYTTIEAPAGAFHCRAESKIRDLSLWRADRPITTPAFGVFAEARVALADMSISGFTNGVRIDASVAERKTNANGWRMRDLTIKGSGHAGVLVRGRDANAGVASGLRVYTSCEHASQWIPELGPAAGIVVRAFLGSNTWVSPLVSTSAEIAGSVRTPYPAYLFIGNSQHDVVVAPYAERDQTASQHDNATMVLGGMSTEWQGLGLRMDGAMVNRLVARNAKDPANVTELRLGEATRAGGFMGLMAKAIDESRPLEIGCDARRQRYQVWLAGQLVVVTVAKDGTFTIVKS